MKKQLLFLVAALALLVPAALSARPRPRPQPVGPAELVVLGHAGAGFFTPISPFNFRPPSSWQGISYALSLGADGVEIDLQLSQDSVLMLYHDQTLENSSTGRGCVGQHPAAVLTQLRYRGGWPYDWFHSERPVTFDTVLARLGRRPDFPRLHLDLHEDDQCAPAGRVDAHARTPALLRELARSLARHRVPLAQVLLVTQVPTTVPLARALVPGLPVSLEIVADNLAAGLQAAQAAQVTTVVLDADRVTPAQTAQAHAAGLRVVVFGGRSAKDIRRVLAAAPDEMEADNVRRLLILQQRLR